MKIYQYIEMREENYRNLCENIKKDINNRRYKNM